MFLECKNQKNLEHDESSEKKLIGERPVKKTRKVYISLLDLLEQEFEIIRDIRLGVDITKVHDIEKRRKYQHYIHQEIPEDDRILDRWQVNTIVCDPDADS